MLSIIVLNLEPEQVVVALIIRLPSSQQLVKRRKGAVQEMREGASDGATYEGEATGVRTHLRKSLKLS